MYEFFQLAVIVTVRPIVLSNQSVVSIASALSALAFELYLPLR